MKSHHTSIWLCEYTVRVSQHGAALNKKKAVFYLGGSYLDVFVTF